MAGVMDIRRRILANTPHIETVSGNGVNFTTDIASEIVACELDLTATQSGTGTPSPSNIRPIIAYKNFDVYHQGDSPQTKQTYSYSWITGRSKGTLDLLTGNLVTEQYLWECGGGSSWNAVGNKFYRSIQDTSFQRSTTMEEQICNMYPFAGIISGGSSSVTEDKHFYLQRDKTHLSYCRVWVYDTDYTLEQFKEMLNQTLLQFTVPLAPYFTSVTAHPITAFKGHNNIWNSNNGDVTVKYWTH